MVYQKTIRCDVLVIAALLLLPTLNCSAQDQFQDHSCTVDAAGEFATPKGQDGKNFDKGGWGVQAGGGFAFTRPADSAHRWRWFITSNFTFEKFEATAAALSLAKASNPTQLASATSAHGDFTAVTLDLNPRFFVNRKLSVYAVGGFGWLRRGVGFNGANPATLLQSNGISLDRVASNSGVFDLGGGVNYGPRILHGAMLFMEARVYRGLAVNGGTTLLPFSLGIRW
jgi:hypothetical protein